MKENMEYAFPIMENFWAVDLFVLAISCKLVRFFTTLFKDLLAYIFPVISNLELQRILCGIEGYLMVKILNKHCLNKLLAVAALMMTCVGMWGCSEDRVHWNEGFTGAEIVGFVDDSLVMVGSYQLRTESHEGTFEPYWDVVESGHERLCVYNYRVQEDGPRWCDTLGEYNMTNAFRGQMTDSIIWGGDMPNSIRLWKIGESQHQIKLKKIIEGCSGEFGIASVKQWLDGKFIARSDNSLNASDYGCQYALLDTVEKTITYKRLDKNLEWIEKCGDVRAWGDDVICSVPSERPLEGSIKKNNKDTLSAPLVFNSGIFWGDMIELRASICSLDNEMILCTDTDFTWREPLKFYKGDEIIVNLE
ncbi:hypothetical protein [uncultured Fibrobacter sp.]|uniref:hypothetical protein n=1 Tax=uncultured Fibrobacter sp. TaxID=261512 RepID=UPI0025937679|nr:hypothetical protein [uncultured Fibrobacter sp.]